MRVLVFCGDLHHPAATARAGLAPLARDFSFDWVAEDAAPGWPARMRDYAAVLFAKSNARARPDAPSWLAGGNEGIFADFVAAGGGLVAVHSGTAGYLDVPPIRKLLGGVFLNHPPPCAVAVEPVAGHPLAAGVQQPFVVHDEHYQVALDDPEAAVFLHTRSEHGVQPAGWTRTVGRGKVCVLTPGHFPEVWLHASFQRLLGSALRWASNP